MRLTDLHRTISAFKALDPKTAFMLSWLHVFSIVADREGLSVGEIAFRASMTPAATGKALGVLCDVDHRGEAGLGLIVQRESPSSRRVVESFLSVKGKAFAERIRC